MHTSFNRLTRFSACILISLTLILVNGCQSLPASSANAGPDAEDSQVPSERQVAYEQIELLASVINRVREEYVDPEKTGFEELVTSALKGMLHELDPHSQFMEPKNYDDMKEGTRGKFGGLGIVIGVKKERLTIISPMEGTPAFEAGLRTGDLIMKIDGEDTSGLSLSEAVDRLRGDIGSDVTLDIFRFDPRSEFNVTIKRAEITVSSVKGTRILEDGIGYIRITQFSSPTSDLLKDALDELRAKEMNALILDLRDNPGGLLSSAIHVSEQFINKGELVVSTRGRPGTEPRVRVAHGDDPILDIPMVILINQGSASASEIVAGALQDHKRAILLGERSFGKGSVQTILPLQGGSALRLTTAKYYTPSEKVIHENGLEPDVVVPVTSDEWSMVRLKMPRLEAPEYYDQDDDETKTRFDQVHDIQLDRAVDLVKGLRIYKERLTSSKR